MYIYFLEEKTTEAPTTTPTTTSNECADRIDCSSFPHSACTNYRTYMSANCPYHCALCPGMLNKPTKPVTICTRSLYLISNLDCGSKMRI